MGSLKGYLASSERKGIFLSQACSDDDGYSSRAVFEWLRARKQDNLCAEFIQTMENGDAMDRATIVNYYLIAKSCDGGAKLADQGPPGRQGLGQGDDVHPPGNTVTRHRLATSRQSREHTERVLLNDGREVVPVRRRPHAGRRELAAQEERRSHGGSGSSRSSGLQRRGQRTRRGCSTRIDLLGAGATPPSGADRAPSRRGSRRHAHRELDGSHGRAGEVLGVEDDDVAGVAGGVVDDRTSSLSRRPRRRRRCGGRRPARRDAARAVVVDLGPGGDDAVLHRRTKDDVLAQCAEVAVAVERR